MAQRKPLIALLVGAIACLAAEAPAGAAPKVSVKTQHYTVKGSSPRELLAYMLRHGPTGSTGPALGTASANIKQNADLRQSGKRCRIVNYRLSLGIVLRLPKLASNQKLSKATRRRWNGLAAYIREHELRHKEIYIQCGRTIERKIRSLSGKYSCPVLHAKMQATFAAENEKCDRRQQKFDAREAKRIPKLALIKQALNAPRARPSRKVQRNASGSQRTSSSISSIELSTR